MSKNNDVCKVLFLPDAKPQDATAVQRAAGLSNGEWGIFNYDTSINIWANDNAAFAATDLPANFIIVYKGNGTIGTAGELYTSAGSHIQSRNVEQWSVNSDNVGVLQSIAVSAMEAESGSTADNYEYGIKFDFRGNSELYQRFGYNQASKFFMANTQCVGSGTASDDADAEVVAQWAEALANDPDQFMNMTIAGTGITNTPVIYTASGTPGLEGVWTAAGSVVTEAVALAGIRAYLTTSVDLTTTFQFQSFSSIYAFCNVNPKYFKQRAIIGIPSLLGGTCSFATVAETVAMKYPEGLGYDVQELEYQAEGFSSKPGIYRQSNLNGLPFSGAEFIAVSSTYYTVCALEYAQVSIGGWEQYSNNISTYIVLDSVPNGATDFPIGIFTVIAAATGAKTSIL